MEVTLDPWKQEDEDQLVYIANNINIWNHVRDLFPHPYTLKDAKDWLNLQKTSHLLQNMAIRYNGSLAGGIRIFPQEDVNRCSAEIGYFIGEPYWNKGIATEAVKQMTDHAFTNFEFARLYALVFQNNKSSMKVLRKAGYELEAIHKKAVIKNDKLMDQYVFVRFNPKFMS